MDTKRTLQLRRGTKEACEKHIGILRDGEPVLEVDTGKVKVGDGRRNYRDLPYVGMFVNGLRYEIQVSD